MVNVDFVISEREPTVFWCYEENIQKESTWVLETLFRQERTTILKSFFSQLGKVQML